jgi:DNA-binding phage protein
MYGYSLALVAANRLAPKNKLGVRLGKACIRANVPVTQVAKDFQVSRTAVYAWFSGRSNPSWRIEETVEQYIKKLA